MPKKQHKQPKQQPKQQRKLLPKSVPRRQAAKQRPAQIAVRRRLPGSGDYLAALCDPFSDRALGSRIPDMFSMPTIPLKLEGVFVLSSDQFGDCSMGFNFNPLLTLIDLLGSTVITSPLPAYGSTTNVFPTATFQQLAGLVATWRLVGAGLQISNLIPELTCTGRVIVAPVPTSQHIPNVVLLNAGSDQAARIMSRTFGIPLASLTTSTNVPTSILALPDAVELTMQQLIPNVLEINPRPSAPHAMNFKVTSNEPIIVSAGGTNYYDGFVPVASTGATIVQNTVAPDLEENTGFTGALLRAQGLPANTASFEVKYIMHLEGSPSVTANSMLPSMTHKSVSLGSMNKALEIASSRPFARVRSRAVQSRLFGNF